MKGRIPGLISFDFYPVSLRQFMGLSNTFTICCELVFGMPERRTGFARSRMLIAGSCQRKSVLNGSMPRSIALVSRTTLEIYEETS
jgi:hypothetical protein